MKKLMIALAAAAVAAGVQAASIDWSNGGGSFKLADGTTTPNGATVYLLDMGKDSTAWTAFKTAVAAGEVTADNIATKDDYKAFYVTSGLTKTTAASATTKSSWQSKYGQAGGTGTAKNDYSNYALLVWDSESKGDGNTYYMITRGAEGTAYVSNPEEGSPAVFGVDDFSAANSQSKGWQMVATPEPTSGLLLLLGVAGLALKRKRA